MRTSRQLLLLCATVAVLAGVAAGLGAFAPQVFAIRGVGPFTFTNVYGEHVAVYGLGIYDHDSLFRGSGQLGVDLVTLFLAIPLLTVSAWFARRGSLRGTLTMTGALCWFVYVGISYLGAVAYNELFLVYAALVSASLFALGLSFAAIVRDDLAAHLDDRIPRRRPAVPLIAWGVVTLGVWLVSPLEGLVRGQPPSDLENYTTLFTNGLDIAVIVPVTILAGVLILRDRPPVNGMRRCRVTPWCRTRSSAPTTAPPSCFSLTDLPGGRSRVHLRVRGHTEPWWLTVLYVGLLVPADYVMATGMLRGLNRRATSHR